MRVDLGTFPVYFVTTAELQHQLLLAQSDIFTRGRIYDRARKLFGNGLATSDGTYHHRQRMLVKPAFGRHPCAEYTGMICRRTQSLVNSWENGQLVQLDREMYGLTLAVMSDIAFSGSLDGDGVEEMKQLMSDVMDGIPVRLATPGWMDGFPVPATSRRFNAAAKRIREIIDKATAEYRRTDAGDRSTDLLSLLLESGGSDSQIQDEIVSLLMAGAETPGSTLSWAFYELAQNRHLEHELRAEIDSVVGSGPIEFDHISELTRTGHFLDEVLRLHPALVFTRRATSTAVLNNTQIPVGTEIAFSPYGIFRDPAVYPSPTQFDPDRWVPAVPIAGRFSPFSVGRHRCIGDILAWTEMIVVLTTIIAAWSFEVVPGSVIKEELAAVPRPSSLPVFARSRSTS